MPTHRHPRLGAAVLALMLLTATATACSDDDADEDVAVADPIGDDTGTDGDGDGDVGAYCDASLAIETAPEPEIDFETATPEEQAEAAKTFATNDLLPLADEVVATAPEEVAGDVAVLVGALEDVAETGDFAAFETEEAEAASKRLHEFDLESCGWNAVDVTAVDYSFEGVPDAIDAGVTSFEFANDGEEMHEMVLFRKNDGVDLSAEELLELPEEEAMTMATFVGATFGEPGSSDEYLVADLEAGDYAMVCFVPTGVTSEAEFETADGPPHFTHGMVAELTVE